MRIGLVTFCGWLLLLVPSTLCSAEAFNRAALAAAISSIDVSDLKQHVAVLADDTFEGREAGTRGGRAAGIYLGRECHRAQLQGAAKQGYYQPFGANYHNILGKIEGADEKLRHEVVLVGAHYDHVGYGSARNSYGPTGYIHNGADDNGSGVAGLLETMDAFRKLPTPPRRTILFAFWDGEEKGLLGSKHWLANPTVPLEDVVCMINLDMIGRLRNNKLDVYGTRTAPSLRQLVAGSNSDSSLLLNCSWEMSDNSDHYPFYERGIPVLMLHTGLHSDYHRPSDDLERLDLKGMQRVTRVLFRVTHQLANQDHRPRFRSACRTESVEMQQRLEQPLAPVAPRMGARFASTDAGGTGVRISSVDANSPAKTAGLRAGDEVLEFAGIRTRDIHTLRKQIWASSNFTTLLVRRTTQSEPVVLNIELNGTPVRVGVSWRSDDAEPGCVILTRVFPGSPAQEAGLLPNDRIYLLNGTGFTDTTEFKQRLESPNPIVELGYERHGKLGLAHVALHFDSLGTSIEAGSGSITHTEQIVPISIQR